MGNTHFSVLTIVSICFQLEPTFAVHVALRGSTRRSNLWTTADGHKEASLASMMKVNIWGMRAKAFTCINSLAILYVAFLLTLT